ncbi:hypothetical protein CRE_14471 [Caenorhabditis remanei]|uniref:Uncharacterized protein n=1 Tax=Caenorhabditis remanei TaxID=31234 RepID=E3M937_CAERE|nr:hypothetical protein CRE_14471 [Caenorhabditis remanei]
MKLHSLLLLLVPAIIAYGEHTTTVDSLRRSILYYVNQLRRQYASKYNVPDMHELIWSDDLVKILKPLDWSLSWPKARITWRYMYFYPANGNPGFDMSDSLIELRSFFKEKTQSEQEQYIEENKIYSAKALEFLNPLQRFIGCGLKKDGDSDIIVCLIGRKGYFKLFDTSGRSSASPGSKCYKRYKKNIDGLCVAENPNRESYYSRSEYFLDDVNDLRRDYANRFNVPDMHELIWSYDLVEILKPLDWTITQLERHKTWRYMYIYTYDNAILHIERYLSSFFDKNESEQKEQIKDSETSSAHSLEWLNPLQRFVGCSPNQDIFEKGSSDIIVCLIGTRGDFKLFDTSGQSSDTPGSKCHKRYSNINGLCVAENPKKESYYSSPEYFLEDVNALRRKYANRFNVPNMHKLIWSDDLVDILKPLNWSLSWPEARKTWRYMYLYTSANVIKDVEEQLNRFLAKTQSEQKQYIENSEEVRWRSAGALELLNPLQRFIGCGPKRDGYSTVVVCLIGSSGDFKMFDTSGQSSASPGSKCYKRYKKNIDGLCVAENPNRESYRSSPEYFLEDVNDMRKEYANRFNVPNMHELIWSTDLVDILKPLNWSLSWPEARVTWRYMYLYTYVNAIKDVEEQLNPFFAKTQSEQKHHIEDSTTYSAKALELLNPLQRFIGCGPKKEGNSNIVVCLIGTSGDFKLFDTSGKSSDSPGSKCNKRYKKIDRLCVAENPDKETYYSNPEYFLEDVNDLRRDYAKQFNVPNMHELIWSNDLVDILKPLNRNITLLERYKTWRYMYIYTYSSGVFEIENTLKSFFAKNESEQKMLIKDGKRYSHDLELLNPLQRFIGCGPNQNMYTGSAKKLVCLIGARGDFTLLDSSGQSSASPGSQCYERYRNIDGLCVAENPDKESYYSTPEYFLNNVNDMRREYANRFNVPNMHELIWNENLVNTVKVLDYDPQASWPEARITWRYVLVNTYDTSSKYIEKEVDEFLELNETEKQNYVNQWAGTRLKMPELINPLQRFMGCAQKEKIIYCLLGTEGGVTLIDTTFEVDVNPGSQCYKNYENDDGLCVPTQEEKLTIGINQIREKYAKLYNVSNMHQLIWSEDLLKFLELGNFSVDLPQIGKTMRYFVLPRSEYLEYWDLLNTLESRIENNYISQDPIERNAFFASNVQTSLGALEFLIPLQKSLACAFVKIDGQKEYVCLIGPSGNPKMFNVGRASVTTHVAASECSARYKNLDGLCVPENPATVSFLGNFSDFLNDVNAVRRKYANKYNISNMHKLTWKESFVTLASSLNCSDNLTCANKTWRYTTDLVYTGITEKIDEEVDFYLTEMSQDEFLEFLKNGESHHVGHLELLNPMQTSIGCFERLMEEEFTVFCLLGDEGNFKMWDLKNVESKAGSNCAAGYDNDDGLCSIPIASIVETTTEESTTGASITSTPPKTSTVEATTKETTTEESTTGASTTTSPPKTSTVETTTKETLRS